MKHISILVPNGQNNITSIVGSYKILTRAGEHSKHKAYQVELVGITESVEMYDGAFTIKPHRHIDEIKKTDLIIIPAIGKNFEESIRLNEQLLPWITRHYHKGAEVASICTGAFILASTGLLDNRHCSTHWVAVDQFRIMFPDVILTPEKLITDESRLYTNGGAFSFLNLILYLVEKYFSRDTAIFCSKIFQIEMDRESQLSFTMFTGQKTHDDDIVRQAQHYIEQHPDTSFTFEKLAHDLAVSRRNFDRRFIKATGNTPVEYHQRVRIEKAKKLFETSSKTIHETMFESGYSDVKAFREVFKKFTGMSPLDYRKRYNKYVL